MAGRSTRSLGINQAPSKLFTPELSSDERGEFVLIANHAIETPEALERSIQYNLARIQFGMAQLPAHYTKCILVYDLRGQTVSDAHIQRLERAFEHLHELRVKR